MKPFHEKLTFTVLAVVLYCLPFLVSALEGADLLKQLGFGIATAMWWPSPTERALKKKLRESLPSEP